MWPVVLNITYLRLLCVVVIIYLSVLYTLLSWPLCGSYILVLVFGDMDMHISVRYVIICCIYIHF